MNAIEHVPVQRDVPSPTELSPEDAPDLVSSPAVEDDAVDPLDAPVELAWESDQADALDQIREVGFDDSHDHEA